MTTRVLVTGGAGFIGSHLVEALASEGYQVKVLDSLIKGKMSSIQPLIDEERVKFIEGDVRSRDAVDRAMKGVDYAFHTAGVHIKRSVESPEDSHSCSWGRAGSSIDIWRSALKSARSSLTDSMCLMRAWASYWSDMASGSYSLCCFGPTGLSASCGKDL